MNYPLYKTTLNPEIWVQTELGYSLKDDVRNTLKKIADDFVNVYLKEKKITLTIDDVVLVGSSANYNWTPFSDIDLHIISDFSKLDMGKEEAQLLFEELKSSWNKSHTITIKGLDVEIYIQDLDHKVDSAAVYSVLNDKWICPPKVVNPKFNKKVIIQKFKEFKSKIDSIIDTEDFSDEETLRRLLDKMYKFRQSGLDRKGEFSEENVVFKILRAAGYIDKIKKVSRKLYDKEMSLNEEFVRDAIWHRTDSSGKIQGIDVNKDNTIKNDRDFIKTDDESKKRMHKVYNVPIFAAYNVEPGAERENWRGSAVMTAIRHAIKHPNSDDISKIDSLIDVSIDRMSNQMNLSEIDVIIPLGSKSELNLKVAEAIVKKTGKQIPILKDFIIKDIWNNVKVKDLGEKSKEGYNKAFDSLKQMQKSHGTEPFEIKHAGLGGQNLRRYFTFFYKTSNGYSIDLSNKITNGNVLIIDDTLEQGATLRESLRVINGFKPKSVKGYIFLFGRYGGVKPYVSRKSTVR